MITKTCDFTCILCKQY